LTPEELDTVARTIEEISGVADVRRYLAHLRTPMSRSTMRDGGKASFTCSTTRASERGHRAAGTPPPPFTGKEA
jgi:hypothetical protein